MTGLRSRVNRSKEEGRIYSCLQAFHLSNWMEGIISKKMSSDLACLFLNEVQHHLRGQLYIPICISGEKMLKDIDLKIVNIYVTIKFHKEGQEEMMREAEIIEIERGENFKKQMLNCDKYPKRLSKIF